MRKKTFNICTNLTNGAGLEQDYLLVRQLLEQDGHKVNGVLFNDRSSPNPPADVTIFMEITNPQFYSKENWLFPNSEWWFKSFDGTLARMDKILCKTQDCLRAWQAKKDRNGKPLGDKCTFTGFLSRDLRTLVPERREAFLHAAGKSSTKNTEAVLAAWDQYKIEDQLTVITTNARLLVQGRSIPNVKMMNRVEDETQFRELMNSHIFHLMPSKYEGFGHVIHEALGCGGIVITTGAPPMNEFHGIDSRFLIPPMSSVPRGLGVDVLMHNVSPKGIKDAVDMTKHLTLQDHMAMMNRSREAFEYTNTHFMETFKRLADA